MTTTHMPLWTDHSPDPTSNFAKQLLLLRLQGKAAPLVAWRGDDAWQESNQRKLPESLFKHL